jgi:hypothetical protein
VVRVLDVRTPPGDTTAFHIHANRLIGVAVEDACTQTQLLGRPLPLLGSIRRPRSGRRTSHE